MTERVNGKNIQEGQARAGHTDVERERTRRGEDIQATEATKTTEKRIMTPVTDDPLTTEVVWTYNPSDQR
ncbi:hypothetical protein NDU88_008650 [Pleurodeles waltl]|uniref:Uncharacterized protein n=1 Tax=Pleurodeles waltl TaxID=8319 RepID=A0AAV7QTD9_PLEWA|nr:hypothetical protein NDU88_008650 [Pleurodeles waltl]